MDKSWSLRLDFEAKMASSHYGTYPCYLLQGLVLSCVPTLTPAATQEGLLAVFFVPYLPTSN